MEPKLRDEDYPEQDFKDYSIHILRTFQELLKSAFDKRDFENFGQFLNAFSKLFERLGRHNRYNDNGEEIKTVYDELDEKREEIVFGLASWILSILKQDSDKDTTKRFYQSIQQHLPSSIEELTKVFMRVHSFDTGDRWGWDWWESRPDEGVHTINTLEKLERLFVVKSLALLRSKTETEIQSINLPHNRDLAFLAEGTRDAMKTIDDIEKNPKNWEFVLDEQSAKQCIALRDLLKKAHDQQEQTDLQRKRETPISKEMVEKFKTSLLSNYNQSHPLKSILKGLRAYSDKSGKSYTGDIKKMGINMVFDKAPFFGDDVEWHIHTIGLDEAFGFGRSMANGENEHILDVIDKASMIIQGETSNQLSL
ncbi:hypothetical protein IPG41_06050 [Candidatus Peregrinibacteria bacterium]|nr:MAG: hypothetical protein IPG41_06050 [Candidatus Peregrinibacteria bacterium]